MSYFCIPVPYNEKDIFFVVNSKRPFRPTWPLIILQPGPYSLLFLILYFFLLWSRTCCFVKCYIMTWFILLGICLIQQKLSSMKMKVFFVFTDAFQISDTVLGHAIDSKLEKEMATHSSVLAWRIPGMGEPGGLPSLGSHRVGHDWSDLAAAAAEQEINFYSDASVIWTLVYNSTYYCSYKYR